MIGSSLSLVDFWVGGAGGRLHFAGGPASLASSSPALAPWLCVAAFRRLCSEQRSAPVTSSVPLIHHPPNHMDNNHLFRESRVLRNSIPWKKLPGRARKFPAVFRLRNTLAAPCISQLRVSNSVRLMHVLDPRALARPHDSHTSALVRAQEVARVHSCPSRVPLERGVEPRNPYCLRIDRSSRERFELLASTTRSGRKQTRIRRSARAAINARGSCVHHHAVLAHAHARLVPNA